jgi:hypothetical protein
MSSKEKTAPEQIFTRKHLIMTMALLATLTLLSYSNSFSVPFLQDDIPSVQENPHIRSLWPIWEAMRAPTPSTLSDRPVASLTFARNFDFQAAEAVWLDTVQKRPDNARALNNLALILASHPKDPVRKGPPTPPD